MSLTSETSNLTLAYINSSNNKDQLDFNITDICNNIHKINGLLDTILEKLNLKYEDISTLKQELIDISNNIITQ
jgi:hypothetical protein